jgi:hypothetical protein
MALNFYFYLYFLFSILRLSQTSEFFLWRIFAILRKLFEKEYTIVNSLFFENKKPKHEKKT